MDLIIFILVLSVLIVVHEFGHFMMAKKIGVRVEKFSLGFGRKLFSRMYKGTEFMVCAVPLGGYVKMAGDERSNCRGESGEFYSKSPGHRALVVFMGPIVNFILAYVCFCFVFMIGYVDVEKATKNLPPVIGGLHAGYPAKGSGLQIGDKIIRIDAQVIRNWDDVQQYILTSKNTELHFTIERKGQELQITVVPKFDIQKDIFGREQKIRRVGIAPQSTGELQEVPVIKYSFFPALGRAFVELMDVTAKTYQALYEMLIGNRSAKEAMGIVGMFFVIKFAISVSFSLFLHLVGIISASLAIFNLLPLAPLDGGHLFLTFLEKIRGRALPIKLEEAIARAGFSLILCLALFVFYADFERVGWIDKIMKLWQH